MSGGPACVAVPGVWSWRTRDARDRGVPIADLDHITWRERTVFIVYDSDVATKPKVRLAEYALATELQRRGADGQGDPTSGSPSGKKVGLDDYLLTHSVETLCALEPIEMLDPATVPTSPFTSAHGDEHQVTWPEHDVVRDRHRLARARRRRVRPRSP